mmetsp:Transcript_4707/g.8028  ORF Transcript_4707/g.8028 Transcript_4707/m.8028 type:complete len:231 (-) Transcript_4707:789-1481(-)
MTVDLEKKDPLSMMTNPLGGGVQVNVRGSSNVGGTKQKLVAILEPPKDNFRNEFIEKLCRSADWEEELSKFDTQRIKLRNKAVEIIRCLNEEEIDLDTLRKLTFTGIPTCITGLRPVVWRLLLGALPAKTADWKSSLEDNFETYENFQKELIVKPKIQKEEAEAKEKQRILDHPLSTSQSSVWNTFFKDQEIWDEIEKDVKRTRTDMHFFQLAIDPSRNKSAEDKARLER